MGPRAESIAPSAAERALRALLQAPRNSSLPSTGGVPRRMLGATTSDPRTFRHVAAPTHSHPRRTSAAADRRPRTLAAPLSRIARRPRNVAFHEHTYRWSQTPDLRLALGHGRTSRTPRSTHVGIPRSPPLPTLTTKIRRRREGARLPTRTAGFRRQAVTQRAIHTTQGLPD